MPSLELTIPYSGAMSKNRLLRFGKGRAYTDPDHRQQKQDLILLLSHQNQGMVWYKSKVWIEILFRKGKEHRRADVTNLVDGVCDALKHVLGVDDRFFTVYADWEEWDGLSEVVIKAHQ